MAHPFVPGSYYTAPDPNGNGYIAVYNGVTYGPFDTLAQAEQTYNDVDAKAQNPTPTGGPIPPTGPADTSGPASAYADIYKTQLAIANANQISTQAYNNAVLELRRQEAGHTWTYQDEQIALQRAADAWHQSIAQQDVDIQRAVVSGYQQTPGLGAGAGQRMITAADQLRANPDYQALSAAAAHGDQAAMARKKQMEVGSVAAATGLPMDQATRLYNDMGARYQATGVLPSAADIDRQLANDPSYQTPTLGREQMQNTTGLGLLTLASQLRGPDNAFAYAKTLANVPQSMRDQLAAMMQRSGINYQGPGLGAVVGQLTQGNLGGAAPNGVVAPNGPGALQQTLGADNATAPLVALTLQPGGAPPAGNGATGAVAPTQPGPTGQGDQLLHSAVMPAYNGPGMAPPGGMPQDSLTQGQNPTAPQHLREMSPTDWNNTPDYLKKLLLAGEEAAGNDKAAEVDQYQRALPKYTGPTAGRLAA